MPAGVNGFLLRVVLLHNDTNRMNAWPAPFARVSARSARGSRFKRSGRVSEANGHLRARAGSERGHLRLDGGHGTRPYFVRPSSFGLDGFPDH